MTMETPNQVLGPLRQRHQDVLAAMLAARGAAESVRAPESATLAIGLVLSHLDWYEATADPAIQALAGADRAFLDLVEGLRQNMASLRYECISFLRACWESPAFGREHRQRFLGLATRMQARADREESLLLWLQDSAKDPSGEWAQPGFPVR